MIWQPFPWFMEFTESEYYILVLVFVLMLVDIVAGLLQALRNREFQSSKMREGIMHKAGTTLVMLLAIVMQGFAAHIGESGWSVPLIVPVCLYAAVMELSSILENLTLLNPELAGTGVLRLFKNDKVNPPSGGDESEA